ncbi:MAG: CHAT domain-containing protein [Gammaproteobacteria bacterium]
MSFLGRLFGTKSSNPKPDSILHAIFALDGASDLDGWRAIVRNHPELLTDEADRLYDELIPGQSDERVKQRLMRYREWLHRCREAGVDTGCTSIEKNLLAGELNNRALQLINAANYREAESLLAQALDELSQLSIVEGPVLVDALYFLGVLHLKMAKYDEAETELRQAISHHRRVYRQDNEQLAAMLGALAEAYRESGDYAKAAPLYDEELDLCRKLNGDNDPGVASSLHNKGLWYFDLSDYAKAQQLLERALEIRELTLPPDSPELATSFNCLGEVHKKWGDFDKAETYLERALEIRRRVLGEQHPDVLVSLNNLGQLYVEMGAFEDARSVFEQALESGREALGNEHPKVATVLNNMALNYRYQGDYAKAEAFYRRAIESDAAALGEDHPGYALDLTNLASVYAATARTREALDLLLQAEAIHFKALDAALAAVVERRRVDYLRERTSDVHQLVSLVLQYHPDSRDAVQRVYDVVLRRKGISADLAITRNHALWANRHPELKRQVERLRATRDEIARLKAGGSSASDPIEYLRQLRGLGNENDRLERELASQVPEASLYSMLKGIDSEAITKALPEGCVLLDFFVCNRYEFERQSSPTRGAGSGERYVVFVVTAEPPQVRLIDLGEAAPINVSIDRFRKAVYEGSGRADDREASLGAELRAALFGESAQYLGACRRMLVAPDGELWRLPFHILPTADGGRFIDAYEIEYLSSARDLLAPASESKAHTSQPVVMGDPDFDLGAAAGAAAPASDGSKKSMIHFSRLPATRSEARKIAALLDVEPLLGADVLKETLRELHSPRILHLATHGFFLPNPRATLKSGGRKTIYATSPLSAAQSPAMDITGAHGERMTLWQGMEEMYDVDPMLRGGLALSGANTGLRGSEVPAKGEDGILTAYDVVGLDLTGTELVVLSACETGVGAVECGEGVFGLRRAFRIAGAQTLIMSLWEVPDIPTEQLMEAFYERLLQGAGKASALRQAQQAIRKKYPESWQWGAFICQGSSGAPAAG